MPKRQGSFTSRLASRTSTHLFMDYELSDTGDGHPSYQRAPYSRGTRVGENGRATGGAYYVPLSASQQLYRLEQDAYKSVLQAFKAQSEVLTWGKEQLMSSLRKVLKISDEQHLSFLREIEANGTFKDRYMLMSNFDQTIQLSATTTSTKRQKTTHPPPASFPPPPSRTLGRGKKNKGPSPKDINGIGRDHSLLPSEIGSGGIGSIFEKLAVHGRKTPPSLEMEGLNRFQQSSLDALIKEVDKLAEEDDLAKIESIKRRAKEHEEMLMRALNEVGEVSDEGEC